MPLYEKESGMIGIAPEQSSDAIQPPRVPQIDFSKYGMGTKQPEIPTDPAQNEQEADTIDFSKYLGDDMGRVEKSPYTTLESVGGGLGSGLLDIGANILTHIEGAINIPAHYDQDSDTYIRPNEYVKVPIDKWENMDYSDKKKMLRAQMQYDIEADLGGDPDSVPYMVSELIGMAAPWLFAPAAAGRSLAARAGTGAAIGAGDIALYESAHEGSPTAGGLFLGAGLGAVAGTLTRSGRKYRGNPDAKIREKAWKDIQDFEKSITTYKNKGMNIEQARTTALKDRKWSDDDLIKVMEDGGHVAIKYKPIDRGDRRELSLFNKLIEPVSVRIREISEPLHKGLQDTLRKIQDEARVYERLVDPFVRSFGRVPGRLGSTAKPGVARDLKIALLTGDEALLKSALKKAGPKMQTKYDDYKKAHDELWEYLKEVRTSKNTPIGTYKDVYMHRAVKDTSALRKWMEKNWGSDHLERIDKILAREFKDGATDQQRAKVFQDYLNGFYDKDGIKAQPKGTKRRRLTKKDFDEHPELVDMFHDPAPATHSYIKEAIHDYHQKKFFGKKVVKEFGDEVSTNMFDLLLKEKGINKNIDELKTLLKSVFINSAKQPDKVIRDFKNITYSGLLGTPFSALVQIGDVFIAAAKYGTLETFQGIWRTALGRGMSPKEMGLMESILEEFVSTGWSNNILRKAFTWSGFKSVDQFGKAVNMNAAIVRAQKQLKSGKGLVKFQAKWGKAYGDDFPELVNAIENWDETSKAMAKIHKYGKNSVTAAEYRAVEHAKSLAFAELADIQPITMLEMPKPYLDVPNGRVAYMLKTFQLKYFNMLRQHFWYELKRGNTIPAIKSGTALYLAYVSGGVATEHIKNFIVGRDSYANDILFDNMIRGMAPGVLDRYASTKLLEASDPLPKFAENLLPPIGFWSPQAVTIMRTADMLANPNSQRNMEDIPWEKMVAQIPVIGKAWEQWFLGGAEEWNAKRWKEHIR